MDRLKAISDSAPSSSSTSSIETGTV